MVTSHSAPSWPTSSFLLILILRLSAFDRWLWLLIMETKCAVASRAGILLPGLESCRAYYGASPKRNPQLSSSVSIQFHPIRFGRRVMDNSSHTLPPCGGRLGTSWIISMGRPGEHTTTPKLIIFFFIIFFFYKK
ncbi:hypothetical protein AOQ84DRAFT_126955 [Glonium stellatum]|uniref:Uncharacterized protein n=1 Tax=Glonium stellatum TaxID=574774 RepID=A0A8E2JNS4_9PEZI|nr:hypothetical protein AOQ84DRAFT_126955 [Glonium stellatum]